MKETIKRFDPNTEFYTAEKCFIVELSNTPDDPEVSIARARVAPGVTRAGTALGKPLNGM